MLFDGWMLRYSNQVRNNKEKEVKEKHYRVKLIIIVRLETLRRTQLQPFRVFPLIFRSIFRFFEAFLVFGV